MAEDFRATLVAKGDQEASALAGRLGDWHPEEELEGKLPDRVVVSHDGRELFIYANTREAMDGAIEAAQRVLGDVVVERRERWHDAEERWEDVDLPLPQTPEEIEAERDRLAERERAESAAHGECDWEVRIDLPDRRDAAELEERLRAEGLHATRRWKYLFVPVESEEDGHDLAERLSAEAGPEAHISVEGTVDATGRKLPFGGNVFAIFGGLGN
jgi:hypothetical protein